MTRPSTIAFALLALSLASCGIDELGVRSVSFSMSPTAVPSPPDDLDARALALIATSSAHVSVDVHEDTGMLMTDGLPDIADTLTYVVMLQFAEHDRAALPGGEVHDGVGHSHGPLSTGPGGLPPLHDGDGDSDVLTTVVLGDLMPTADAGVWMREFTSDDISGESIGALRAAMIMVVPNTGTAAMVMFGKVEEMHEGAAGGEEGGHSHGP